MTIKEERTTAPELPTAPESAPTTLWTPPERSPIEPSKVADQALELLRAWTSNDPSEADPTRIACAIDTVIEVHRLAHEKLRKEGTP